MSRLPCQFLLLLFAAQIAFSQGLSFVESSQHTSKAVEAYPVSGCQALWKEELKLRQYLADHPEVLLAPRLHKTAAWNFKVGDSHSWWATNLVTKTEYSVPSTCRAVGTRSYIFAEDSLWISGRVNQAAVDSIVAAFENRTPANPQKGIYDIDVETFGDPPDVDSDPKIIILILDIKDGFTGSGGYTAGYFFSLNEYSQQQVDQSMPGRKTNHAEIYYIDGNPGNLTSASGLATAASTTAHEFQHMIHWNADNLELAFINESCSEAASLVCGYSYPGQSLYTDDTDVYLLDWLGTLEDYSRAARWGLYLWNQFPNGYLKMLVSKVSDGIAGMNNAFTQYPSSRRFDDVFVDWLIANHVNDAGVDPRYAYTFSSSLTKPRALSYVDPNTGSVTDTVTHLGADYIAFTNGSDLSITFSSGASTLQVKALETGPAGKRIMDVPLNTTFIEPGFGTSYTNVTFLVFNSSQTTDAPYTYQATGTFSGGMTELKYDDTEPTGYLPNAVGDTVCVWFDAVPGAKLDSVRVALRRAGSMTGGIWRYTGSSRPSPLGTPLAVPLTATVSSTPGIPYPVPWPNWATIDLRSYNLSANQPFAVAFRCEGLGSISPRVMVTQVPLPSVITSYTYSTTSSSGPNWYYYTSNQAGDSVYIYLIRAYVSYPTTAVQEGIELQPRSFSLGHNYPNPFNPSTTIRYSVPFDGHVKLRVYDVIGRVVATLVNQDQSAGVYSVEWLGVTDSGQSMPSGVYLYRLETAEYQSTQKMVLLR